MVVAAISAGWRLLLGQGLQRREALVELEVAMAAEQD
jgi:hypothetical protein